MTPISTAPAASFVSPPEFFQNLGSLDLRLLNVATEELLKATEKTLGRTLLDDFSNRIRKPDRSELRQRTWSRQRHIHTEPPQHFADAAWKCPMKDEARICCGALQGVQRAGGNDGKRKLQSLHTQLPCNAASLAFPLECDRHFEALTGELRSDVDLALEKLAVRTLPQSDIIVLCITAFMPPAIFRRELFGIAVVELDENCEWHVLERVHGLCSLD